MLEAGATAIPWLVMGTSGHAVPYPLGGVWFGGNGNPLQYSFLGNPTDTEPGQATVSGVTKSQTLLRTHASLQAQIF